MRLNVGPTPVKEEMVRPDFPCRNTPPVRRMRSVWDIPRTANNAEKIMLRDDTPSASASASAASRWEWKVPLAVFLVGLSALVAAAFTIGGFTDAARATVYLALVLLISVPLTIAAMYIVAGLLGVSFGLLKTAVLKLAAIAVFSTAVNVLANGAGHPLLGWLGSVAVTFYLFSQFFDLDLLETFLSVVLISVLRFVLALGIAELLDRLT
jgi:hypothetical protein